MKHILLYGVLLLCSINLIAQEETPDFMSDINQFMTASTEGDWDVFLDKTYPGLFKLVPREQLTEVLKNTIEGIELQIIIDSIDHITGPFHADSVTTYRIDYYNTSTIGLDSASWSMKDIMIGVYEMNEGFLSSEVDEANQSLVIKAISTMIAVKEDDVDEWKYLQYQPEQKMMFGLLLPASVISEMFPE